MHAFPTLLFFEKGGKKIRRYSGPRTFDSIAKFAQSGWKDVEECARAIKLRPAEQAEPSLLALHQLLSFTLLTGCDLRLRLRFVSLLLRRARRPAAAQATQVDLRHAEGHRGQRQKGRLRAAPNPHALPSLDLLLGVRLKGRRGARRRPAEHGQPHVRQRAALRAVEEG